PGASWRACPAASARRRATASASRSTSTRSTSSTRAPARASSRRSTADSIGAVADKTPSQLIDERIAALDDGRGALRARLRGLVKDADPEIVEEWKWRGVPTWYHDGIVCTGETYKSVVKMTFAKGASLDDPAGLFNSSLDGNVRRAIDFAEGAEV